MASIKARVDRINRLEADNVVLRDLVAQLAARVATLEAPSSYGVVNPATVTYPAGGYTCTCGAWVAWGSGHTCYGYPGTLTNAA